MMLPPALRLHALLSPPEFGMFHRTGAQTAVAVRFDSRSASITTMGLGQSSKTPVEDESNDSEYNTPWI
ncbi:unnamed protein product [Arctogadus glacialis]